MSAGPGPPVSVPGRFHKGEVYQRAENSLCGGDAAAAAAAPSFLRRGRSARPVPFGSPQLQLPQRRLFVEARAVVAGLEVDTSTSIGGVPPRRRRRRGIVSPLWRAPPLCAGRWCPLPGLRGRRYRRAAPGTRPADPVAFLAALRRAPACGGGPRRLAAARGRPVRRLSMTTVLPGCCQGSPAPHACRGARGSGSSSGSGSAGAEAAVAQRLDRLEKLLEELCRGKAEMRAEVTKEQLSAILKEQLTSHRSVLKEQLSGDRRLWQPETAERLHEKVLRLEAMVAEPLMRIERDVESFVGRLKIRGHSVVNKWSVAAGLAALAVGYVGRHIIRRAASSGGAGGYAALCGGVIDQAHKERDQCVGQPACPCSMGSQWFYGVVADETAELGKAVMEKNTENIVHTLNAIARDPETLAALVALLVSLIDDPAAQGKLLQLLRDLFVAESTRKALLDLLVWVFQDEYLCRLTGEFLLYSLDKDTTRPMLERQLAALVSATALDRKVQQDAGVFANQSLKDALLPRWLRHQAAAAAQAE
ncbi:unnamed protein product [Prorocentrum cordatum]|uniref:Uncharacterized protein n=1 Tax=Prorocentrum cordatum TaxID=2364126 RepID=A0ABN9Q2C0_9DINO|nr:unnamed protein product [Polarella glacialis]